MGFETQDVERKVLAILKVLSESSEALGARVIARHLKDLGIELGERAVRYHLKLMDERGLTRLAGRDGRVITELGLEEVDSALVQDKVGFAISRIELLAFRTDFDLDKQSGPVPVNVSLFPEDQFGRALRVMRPVFEAGFCVSDLVGAARAGDSVGELVVPQKKVAFSTVCSIVVNGTLLKAGVPMDSRFGGLLQVRNRKPMRFVEIVDYAGSSLDPSEVFISAGMTSVGEVVRSGNGRILANFRQIPALSRPLVESVQQKLQKARMGGGVLVMGTASDMVCRMPVETNRVGIVLLGGLNPVAAAKEAGIEVVNHAMSAVADYGELVEFNKLLD